MPAPLNNDNRARILDAATEILETVPYVDLRLESLTRLLHISKSTVYKHFISKEAIVDAIVEDVCDATDAALQVESDAPPRADIELRRVLQIHARYVDSLPRAVLLERKKLPSTTQARLVMTRLHLEDALKRALVRGRDQQVLRIAEPELVGSCLLAAMDAATEHLVRSGSNTRRAVAVRVVTDALLMGILPR
jgi:AcrR family transcriptional regulator